MKRLLPQTMPGWILLIVISGLLIAQTATFTIMSRDQRAANETVELYRINERAFSLVKLLSSASSDQERRDLINVLDETREEMTVTNSPGVRSPIASNDSLAELEDIMTSRLARFGVTEARVRIDPPGAINAAGVNPSADSDSGEVERDLQLLGRKLADSEHMTVSIRLSDGKWLNFVAPMTPVGVIAPLDSLPLYGAVAALVGLMAMWAIHRLTAPYRLMERAVHRIGVDLKSPPVSEQGSREYRAAAHAVNTMQARLREYVEDREQLTAALAHDLRTPLTRMRLRMEGLADAKLRKALTADVDEIESIARSVVDFSTMEVAEEEMERVDVASLVHALADDRAAVRFAGAPPRTYICEARPVALRRCVTNLIENAIKYGGKADVSLQGDDVTMALRIVDHGPGIPPDQLEAVFRPFVRVEKSRNRDTGGTGLGLTIARNIARSLGGDIQIENAAQGGLITELTLPRAHI